MDIKIGFGRDIHELIPGDGIILGAFQIPCRYSIKSYSDGDVVIHSLVNAILGALGEGDIGVHFSDKDPINYKRSSVDFLFFTKELLEKRGFVISNIDISISLEKIHLSQYFSSISQSLADILAISANRINIKAGTNEGFDSVGEGRAIVSYSIVLLVSKG
jgi:2-C-methyl-D-erythritol 2,4-cyclodiphosphate synthase